MTPRNLFTICFAGTLFLLPACAASREREQALQAELHAMRDHVRALEMEAEHLRMRMHEMDRDREVMHRMEIERELAHEMEMREREGRGRGGRGEDGVHEVMRAAVELLVDTDRHDLAEQMELALHRMELDRERRDDPEAMHVRERAPSLGDTAEIRMHCANVWEEMGWETRAEQARDLGRVLMKRAEHERQQGQHGGADHEMRAAFEKLHERLAEVEDRLDKMGQRLKRVFELMEELAEEG
jgi:hypothetical protein